MNEFVEKFLIFLQTPWNGFGGKYFSFVVTITGWKVK